MGLTIIKTDFRGAYRLVAEHDLYLEETGQKVIVVKAGEEVPKEAALVLAGKGGTIPPRYADMLRAMDKVPESEPLAEVKAEVKPEPAPEPSPEATEPSEAKPVKPKKSGTVTP